MLGRLKLIAVSALSVTLLCGGPAAAQTPPPDSLAAAKELVVTMRAADQLKNLLPVIMQQLKPAIVLGQAGQKWGQTVAGEMRGRIIEELRKRGHNI